MHAWMYLYLRKEEKEINKVKVFIVSLALSTAADVQQVIGGGKRSRNESNE